MAAQQLHASFPNSFFFLFSWLLPKHLAAARFPIFSSYSRMIAASPSHTHTDTLRLPSPAERRVVVRLSVLFSSPPFRPGAPQGSFIFISALPSSVRLGKKNPYCHLHSSRAAGLFLPCPSISESGRSLGCCCAPPSSSIAVFVQQERRWQSFTPLS